MATAQEGPQGFSRKPPSKPSGRHDGTLGASPGGPGWGGGPGGDTPHQGLGYATPAQVRRSWGFDGRDCERLIVSCDQSRRVGRKPPRLLPRPQASAQTRPLHGGTTSSPGGGPRGCSGAQPLGGSGGSPHFRAGGGGWCRLQGPAWRAFCAPSNCCRRCLSLKPGPGPALVLRVLPTVPGGRGVLAFASGSAWCVGCAWRGSKSDARACLSSLLSASPRGTESDPDALAPTWTPARPQIAPGSPPDGSAAPAQKARFGVTWQGPGEEEIHLYNKSTNGFLAHELFIRYLSGILKVGSKQHGICQDASSQPEERKNSQGESEMPLPAVHTAGATSGLMGPPYRCPFLFGRCWGVGPAICLPCGSLGLPLVSGSMPGCKREGQGFLRVGEPNWPGGHRVQ